MSMSGADRLHLLKIGQTERIARTITGADVAAFARLSGDHNALHVDDEFAARTEFGQRVVHGFLHASLLSTLVGMKLPGPGALYVSQVIEFTKPVFIGDTVEARATVEKIDCDTRLVTLRTEILRSESDCVMRGIATVKVLRIIEEEQGGRAARPTSASRLLEGRVALVTGASRGIGRAVARLFGEHGAKVWINYYRSQSSAEALVREIAEGGGVSWAIQADVTCAKDVARMMDEVAAQGGIDVLVNNAGPKIVSAPFSRLQWGDLSTAYEQIVGSAFRVTQAALPALKERRGKIITILSAAALGRTAHNWLPYVAAKGALLAMSKNLAQELGPDGITVNMISPSLVETDLVANVPDRMREMAMSRTPLRRLATPDDVAGAALMLASPYASFITGENMLVTGGEHMH
jgi:3-oxoacyl-[acyl-carrier protein] reductase